MHNLRPFRPKSLFARFFLTFLFTMTVSTMAIILLMPRQLEGLLVAHAERDIINKIARVRPSAERFLSGRLMFAEIQNTLALLEDLLGGGLYIADQQGTIRAFSPLYGSELLNRQITEEDFQTLQEGHQFTRREADSRTLTIAVPITQDVVTLLHGRQTFYFGALYLQVPLEALRTTALVTGQQLAAMPLIVCLTALAMGGLISRSLSRPLQRLSLATLHMAQGDYTTRVTERRDDELGQLGSSFNRMAVSLEMSIRHLRDERDRIHNLIHALTEGVIATDAERRILLLNPAAAEYLHLDLESTMGS
ncbi:MAG: cell wall metabolism sensor histidine kinase WalK, partial [Symbiobacteriaceae bacterium]|nr:cell wall metabolism sensor histidine kinase WalK [Symbiobacteriaceae bacterium]